MRCVTSSMTFVYMEFGEVITSKCLLKCGSMMSNGTAARQCRVHTAPPSPNGAVCLVNGKQIVPKNEIYYYREHDVDVSGNMGVSRLRKTDRKDNSKQYFMFTFRLLWIVMVGRSDFSVNFAFTELTGPDSVFCVCKIIGFVSNIFSTENVWAHRNDVAT